MKEQKQQLDQMRKNMESLKERNIQLQELVTNSKIEPQKKCVTPISPPVTVKHLQNVEKLENTSTETEGSVTDILQQCVLKSLHEQSIEQRNIQGGGIQQMPNFAQTQKAGQNQNNEKNCIKQNRSKSQQSNRSRSPWGDSVKFDILNNNYFLEYAQNKLDPESTLKKGDNDSKINMCSSLKGPTQNCLLDTVSSKTSKCNSLSRVTALLTNISKLDQTVNNSQQSQKQNQKLHLINIKKMSKEIHSQIQNQTNTKNNSPQKNQNPTIRTNNGQDSQNNEKPQQKNSNKIGGCVTDKNTIIQSTGKNNFAPNNRCSFASKPSSSNHSRQEGSFNLTNQSVQSQGESINLGMSMLSNSSSSRSKGSNVFPFQNPSQSNNKTLKNEEMDKHLILPNRSNQSSKEQMPSTRPTSSSTNKEFYNSYSVISIPEGTIKNKRSSSKAPKPPSEYVSASFTEQIIKKSAKTPPLNTKENERIKCINLENKRSSQIEKNNKTTIMHSRMSPTLILANNQSVHNNSIVNYKDVTNYLENHSVSDENVFHNILCNITNVKQNVQQNITNLNSVHLRSRSEQAQNNTKKKSQNSHKASSKEKINLSSHPNQNSYKYLDQSNHYILNNSNRRY